MTDWRPTTSVAALHARAKLLATIRQFFAERGILEVETPLLGESTTTDPNIHSFSCTMGSHTYFLQTSPEYPMKRLLAAGSGSIYQVTKAFRKEESGRLHNPEFTMLEWYRVGFDHHQLMDEVDALLQLLLSTLAAERVTYQALFLKYLRVDPLTASLSELASVADQQCIDVGTARAQFGREDWLSLLFTHCIEPHIGQNKPCFVLDYPAAQAALAQTRGLIAERFEVYYHGMELGNGYHELADAQELIHRYETDLQKQPAHRHIPLDQKLIAALEAGFPECAGIAMGLDRVLMIQQKAKALKEVVGFCLE